MKKGPNGHMAKLREKWHFEFSFLKEIPLRHAFLAMFGMAKNPSHLNRLHKMLPNNSQLLDDDWIRLEKFWRIFFTGPEAEKFRGQLEAWILEEQLADPNSSVQEIGHTFLPETAGAYYISRLRQRVKIQPKYFTGDIDGKGYPFRSARILSCVERSGNGDSHFQIRMFGAVFNGGFILHEDNLHIKFFFTLKRSRLTKEVTFKITKLTDFYLPRCGFVNSRISASKLELFNQIAFELEAGDLKRFTVPDGHDLVANKNFASAAADFLRQKGIPVEGDLLPIITKVKLAETGAEEPARTA